MLIVYGGVKVKPEAVAELQEKAGPFEAATRAEAGCVQYVLSWRLDDPTRVQLLEAWEKREAWQAHKTQPHTKEWSAWIPGVAAGPPAFTVAEGEKD